LKLNSKDFREIKVQMPAGAVKSLLDKTNPANVQPLTHPVGDTFTLEKLRRAMRWTSQRVTSGGDWVDSC
jgi:hypothetical protein